MFFTNSYNVWEWCIVRHLWKVNSNIEWESSHAFGQSIDPADRWTRVHADRCTIANQRYSKHSCKQSICHTGLPSLTLSWTVCLQAVATAQLQVIRTHLPKATKYTRMDSCKYVNTMGVLLHLNFTVLLIRQPWKARLSLPQLCTSTTTRSTTNASQSKLR